MCAMLRDVSEEGGPEEAVRARLAVLASAAGVPVPTLKVVRDPKRRLPAASPDEEADDDRPTVEVTDHLLTASAAEQD
jgi:hypothetical protein